MTFIIERRSKAGKYWAVQLSNGRTLDAWRIGPRDWYAGIWDDDPKKRVAIGWGSTMAAAADHADERDRKGLTVMAGEELKAIIINAGMTQAQFARIVGVDLSTLKRWLWDAARIPKAVALLAVLLKNQTITPAQLAEIRMVA